MRREGWIYALAFLAILGVGALVIVPRLNQPAGSDETATSDYELLPEAPREAGPAVQAFEGKPAYAWVEVSVRGVSGGLRGPLRTVHGADVEALAEAGARVQKLRVRPREAVVVFGAAGHQWLARSAASLTDGATIELPEAAPALVVRVREVDGRPAEDVPVRVEPAPPGPAPRTDAGGTLVLDHLPPGLVVIDLASDMRHGPRLRLRPGVDRDVRVTLDPAWTVTGRVVDRSGTPQGGARITAFGPGGVAGPIVETRADGTFRWHGPAVARLSLRVRAPGWGEHSVAVQPPAVGALATDAGDIKLETAGVTIFGVVTSELREADAHVEIEPQVAAVLREVYGPGQVLDRPRRAPIGADGRFRLDDLPAELALRVSVRGAGVPVDVIVKGRPGEEIPVELTPAPGEALVGMLARPDGTPAAGVRLLVSHEPRDGDLEQPGDLVVVSGADGSFAKRGLVGRLWFLRAYMPGARSLLQRVALPLRDPLKLRFDAPVVDATRRVEGRVHDGVRTDVKTTKADPLTGRATDVRYGRGLAGVTVRAAGIETLTDAEGRFRLDSVESLAPSVGLAWGFEAGPLSENAADPGPFVASGTMAVTPGGKPLDLVLQRAAGLRLRAVDAITDAPLGFVQVVVRTDTGHLVFDRGLAPRDGVVELRGLPPRGVEVTVLARDRRFQRSPVVLRPGQVKDLGDVLLRHGMRIEGRVVDEEGAGIPGARIGAFGKGWQHGSSDPAAERELIFRTAVADDQGRFLLRGFDPRKPADLAVWAKGYAPTATRVELPKFSDVVLAEPEVKLVKGAFLAVDLHVQGTVRRRGSRIRGALIDVEFAYGGFDYLDLLHRGMLGGVVSSSEGWRDASAHLLFESRGIEGYLIGPVRPGPYELWVERLGYKRLRQKLTVIDPKHARMVDVRTGKDTWLLGRVTRLQFELDPSR